MSETFNFGSLHGGGGENFEYENTGDKREANFVQCGLSMRYEMYRTCNMQWHICNYIMFYSCFLVKVLIMIKPSCLELKFYTGTC